MQLANSRRLIKGIQLLLNDLIWQIATLGEGALLHTMLLSQQCIHCAENSPLAEAVLGRAFPRTTLGSGTLDHLWICTVATAKDHPQPSPQSQFSSDSFQWCFWFIPYNNTGAKLNCSDQHKTGCKVKQSETTKSKFCEHTDCELIPVLAPFCRKAGRERSHYSETLLYYGQNTLQDESQGAYSSMQNELFLLFGNYFFSTYHETIKGDKKHLFTYTIIYFTLAFSSKNQRQEKANSVYFIRWFKNTCFKQNSKYFLFRLL